MRFCLPKSLGIRVFFVSLFLCPSVGAMPDTSPLSSAYRGELTTQLLVDHLPDAQTPQDLALWGIRITACLNDGLEVTPSALAQTMKGLATLAEESPNLRPVIDSLLLDDRPFFRAWEQAFLNQVDQCVVKDLADTMLSFATFSNWKREAVRFVGARMPFLPAHYGAVWGYAGLATNMPPDMQAAWVEQFERSVERAQVGDIAHAGDVFEIVEYHGMPDHLREAWAGRALEIIPGLNGVDFHEMNIALAAWGPEVPEILRTPFEETVQRIVPRFGWRELLRVAFLGDRIPSNLQRELWQTRFLDVIPGLPDHAVTSVLSDYNSWTHGIPEVLRNPLVARVVALMDEGRLSSAAVFFFSGAWGEDLPEPLQGICRRRWIEQIPEGNIAHALHSYRCLAKYPEHLEWMQGHLERRMRALLPTEDGDHLAHTLERFAISVNHLPDAIYCFLDMEIISRMYSAQELEEALDVEFFSGSLDVWDLEENLQRLEGHLPRLNELRRTTLTPQNQQAMVESFDALGLRGPDDLYDAYERAFPQAAAIAPEGEEGFHTPRSSVDHGDRRGPETFMTP